MARTWGRIATRIWADPDFIALREAEQRAFMVALSQSSLSHAGVLSFTLRRWEGLASDSTVARLRKAFLSLQQQLYVLIDETTEEMFLRTFLRHDGILANPNVATASAAAYDGIHSPAIRGAFLVELHRLNADPHPDPKWDKGWSTSLGDLLTKPFPKGFPDPLLDHLPEWCEYARAAPTPSPSPVFPTACDHGEPEPSRCPLCRVASRNGLSVVAR